jgi:transposase
MVEFMQQVTTITSEVYCETLIKLHRIIQNKRRGMLIYSALVLHDNAHPHTAAHIRALLEHFNWELFDHSPYSPDRAPSDCYLFTYLKNYLGSQRFSNNDELDGRSQNVAEFTGGRLLSYRHTKTFTFPFLQSVMKLYLCRILTTVFYI